MSASGLSMLTNIQAHTDPSAHMHTKKSHPRVPNAPAVWVSPEHLRPTEIFSFEIISRGSTDSRVFEERVRLFLIAGINSCLQGDLQQRATSVQHKCFVFVNTGL